MSDYINIDLINNDYVYKICPIREWKKSLSKGKFEGYGIDVADKFIHFSSAIQVKETLNIHYKGVRRLCLLKVSSKDLNIKWEKARNGQLFPHLYDTFNINCVTTVITLKLNDKGVHILPALD